MNITLPESIGWRRGPRGIERSYAGELEFEIRDRNGRTLQIINDHNIVKIFAKEILSHSIAPERIWDPNASTGVGAWVDASLSLDDFRPRYIVFGASFDPVDRSHIDGADTRYYTLDQVSGAYVPIRLGVGADYGGGLINAIPISEPIRPLKRVERIYFEPSYQPAGTPLLASDVRAMNNTIVLETTLRKDEYNGFGLTSSDYFTITEVALVAAPEIDDVGACECDPRNLFLNGTMGTAGNEPLLATATGTAAITLSAGTIGNMSIREGDQVKIVSYTPGTGGTDGVPSSYGNLDQVSPYYLVISKVVGGSDVVLDRTPVDSRNVSLTGQIGVFRDQFRVFSHRVLKSPFKKTADFEVVTRWRLIMS